MQKWEYRVFASHLDPAELVVILNASGREGWELVTLAPITDYYPPHLIEPTAAAPRLDADEAEEVIAVGAFRYIFKRPLDYATVRLAWAEISPLGSGSESPLITTISS